MELSGNPWRGSSPDEVQSLRKLFPKSRLTLQGSEKSHLGGTQGFHEWGCMF